MIVSASRRTDIPAFYGEWFINRLRAGYALVRNPMNHRKISRVALDPESVDCFVFWTKDHRAFAPRLREIERMGYDSRYYFQYTITPYGRDIEPNVLGKDEIAESAAALGHRLGRKRVVWRYDPILIADGYDVAFHTAAFGKLCAALEGRVERCVLSLVDEYAKNAGKGFRAPTDSERDELFGRFSALAAESGISLRACAEAGDYSRFGILPSSCVDKALAEAVCGCPLELKRDQNQRAGCGCFESVDIGAYNTCPHVCSYCYANRSPKSSVANFSAHDPSGELLFGAVGPDDDVADRPMPRRRREQLRFF